MIRYVRKSLVIALASIPLAFLALSLSACEKEGPAEKAGKKIDQAVEETKEDARELKENVEETYKKKTE